MHIHNANGRYTGRSSSQLHNNHHHHDEPAGNLTIHRRHSHLVWCSKSSPKPSSTPKLTSQGLQSFNTQAVTWGGLAKQMYSWGSTYEWVPLGLVLGFFAPIPIYALHRCFPKVGFDYFNVSIISWHIGWLVTGINSAIISFIVVAFWSQYYLRRYKPEWFLKFNYVLCAGLDGGTQVIVFILTFAFMGASGKPVPFPIYWGNNGGNIDFCMVNPANSG